MHQYAQTNIQLFNQLQRDGCCASDLACIHAGYALASRLFSALYRPSGKTFIAHAVGTASILAACEAPITTVAAGLLHAACEHGDFGRRPPGMPQARRAQLRDAVGDAALALVEAYPNLHWRPQDIHQRFAALGPLEREVLLIRLANELEDHLDGGVLYCPNADARRRLSGKRAAVLVDLAAQLGQPYLAAELERVFADTVAGEVPAQLRNRGDRSRAYLVPPESYRPKLFLLLQDKATQLIGRIGVARMPDIRRLRRR